MFDRIARFYDVLNTALSVGRDAVWRRRAIAEARLRPGDRVVDVCCGTGRLTRGLRRAVGEAGGVIGIDFSAGMLAVARRRVAGVEFRQEDAVDLASVGDSTQHAVTIAFGLRNIQDRVAALRSMHRVLRPGGRVVVLELSTLRAPLLGSAYTWYLRSLLPRVGGALDRRGGAYAYLPASVAAWPDPATVSGWIREAGFEGVRVVRLTLGAATLHVAVRPQRSRGGAGRPPRR